MRWKRVLLIGAGVIVLGGAGLAATTLLTYHEATKIDRSDPEVVTDEYLRSVLVRKDTVGADLHSCGDKSKLAPIRALRDDLDRRERDFDVSIVVSWGAYERTESAVTTELTITARKGAVVESTSRERWRFTVVDEDGWRVCGAERLPDDPA